MKKNIALTFTLAAFSSVALAEVGVGVSLRSNDTSIYVPWQVAPQFRVEGELRYLEQDKDYVNVSSVSTTPQNVSSTSETLEYGLGFFWTPEIDDDWLLLFGLRASYVDSENSSKSEISSSTSDLSGTELAPTLGLEYAFSPKVKVAIEASYFDRELNGDVVAIQTGSIISPIDSKRDVETNESGTNTRIVFRYFF